MIQYRTILAITIFLAFAATTLPAQSRQNLQLMKPGTLTVCISKNAYPPMYWKEGGKLQGFDIDSLHAIAEVMGLELSFSSMAFDGLMPGLMSGRCDLLRSGLYISEERTQVADAVPYLKTGPALLVREDDVDKITSAKDFAGKTVAVQASSANKPAMERLSDQLVSQGYEPIKLANYPEMPETVGAVRNYKANALVETGMAAIAISQNENVNLAIVHGVFDETEQTSYGMYFRRGNTALEQATLQSMSKLAERGTFIEIAKKYDIPIENLVKPNDIVSN